MVSFIVYDVIFLVLSAIIAVIFLYRNKQNVARHGIIFMYRSKFGLRFIDGFAKKFGSILRPAQTLIIGLGYVLMITVTWLLIVSAYNYITSPYLAEAIRAPPIAPLIPYFPAIFNLEAIFPPLYFTFFIIALTIVGVSHEFAHGIIARLNNLKILKTGIILLGPFILGAFVEPDEKQMVKAPKKAQMAVLAAGTFANLLMTVLFGAILWAFFALSFSPAGVNFQSYPFETIQLSSITMIGGVVINDISEIPGVLDEDQNYLEIEGVKMHRLTTDGASYFVPKETLLIAVENEEVESLRAFNDLPAINIGLRSPILEINGETITNRDQLSTELDKYGPGDMITVTSLDDSGNEIIHDIELGSNSEGDAFLGVGFFEIGNSNTIGGLIREFFYKTKGQVYYEANWNADLAWFIYNLLWWITGINLLVAFFNMLPVALLDGGRFFYLTIWGITGKEKWGKKAFSWATWGVLLILLLMMVRWSFTIFNTG